MRGSVRRKNRKRSRSSVAVARAWRCHSICFWWLVAMARLRTEVLAKTVRQVADSESAALVDRGAKNEY